MDIEKNINLVVIDNKSSITMNFSLSLDSGEVIDSNFEKSPVKFVMGDGNLLPGFENVLIGLKAGDRCQFSILPESAFGQSNPENIHCFARHQVETMLENDNQVLEIGLVLSFADKSKSELPGVISRIDGKNVYVDFNHPLSDKVILFDVHILEVKN